MGMASHLGPWLLGTQKNTIGTVNAANAALGQNRNMGATLVTQTATINGNNGAVTGASTGIVIPAGSLIVQINILIDTAYTAGTTVDFLLNTSSITNGTQSISTAGTNVTFNAGANATKVGLWQNTGSVDKVLNYTTTNAGSITAGNAVVVVVYAVRNADGTTAPTSSQA